MACTFVLLSIKISVPSTVMDRSPPSRSCTRSMHPSILDFPPGAFRLTVVATRRPLASAAEVRGNPPSPRRPSKRHGPPPSFATTPVVLLYLLGMSLHRAGV